MLAERILSRHNSAGCIADTNFPELLRILGGHPLAMEIVLANLQFRTPGQVLANLRSGDIRLDTEGENGKTRSIRRCIEYSFEFFPPAMQKAFLILAPFTSVLNINAFGNYTRHVGEFAQFDDIDLSAGCFQAVFEKGKKMGLVEPHPERPDDYLRLHPVFPFFLNARLHAAGKKELLDILNKAFYLHYTDWAGAMVGLETANLMEKFRDKKKPICQILLDMEYENLNSALKLALDAGAPVGKIFEALSRHVDMTHQQEIGIRLCEMVLERLKTYPKGERTGLLGAQIAKTLDNIGKRRLHLEQFADAEKAYLEALKVHEGVACFNNEDEKNTVTAGIYHQLGKVSAGMRDWRKAGKYFQKARKIEKKLGKKGPLARTLFETGKAEQEQGNPDKAKACFQEALDIFTADGNTREIANCNHPLGIVFQLKGESELSKRNYLKAILLYGKCGAEYEKAGSWNQLGILAHEFGNLDEAETNYKKALDIYIDFTDKKNVSKIYHNLGVISQERKRWEEAEEYYLKALAYMGPGLYETAGTLRQCGITAGERHQLRKAERYLAKALKVYRDFNDIDAPP